MAKADVLQLNLERKYFDEIAVGKKDREYREYKPHWTQRLEDKDYDIVRFKNGYGPNVPEMDVECLGVRVGTSRDGRRRYVIRLGKILKLKRWRLKQSKS